MRLNDTLQDGWKRRRLRFDVKVNPVKSELKVPQETEVSFVPMDAVGEFGGLDLSQTRPLDEVYNGYTYFTDGDVCIAKITPCFENGKGALAQNLTNGIAFGTTELHILRPLDDLDARFLFYLTFANDFRSFGEAEMIGAGGQKRVPESFLKDWVTPLPPLPIQRRIAQSLDEKTTQIDDLNVKINNSIEVLAEYRAALITAAVTGQIENLLDSNVVETSAKREVPNTFKRVVLAAYIADNLCDRSTFGRVMFQKALHLCEFHAGVTEIGGNYIRDAAGPFDPQMMQSVHSQLSQQKWFQIHKRTGGKGYSYRRGGKLDTYRKYFHKYFNDRKQAIDDLLTLLSQMNTEQAEIVSTAYAAWNDLLLDGRKATTDEIIHLILNEWADEKRRISIHRWHKALDWMRNIGLVPKGTGSHTRMKRA